MEALITVSFALPMKEMSKSRASGSIVPVYKVTSPEPFIFNAASNKSKWKIKFEGFA